MDRLSTCVIGIDLGGTYIKGAALDLTGQILSEGKIATEVAQGQERVLNNVTGLIADLCKMSGGRSLAGVGLGVPGALDFKEGRIIESPNFPGWDNFPIRSQVEKAVGVPVVIENDASAAAMGERWVGAAQNVDNFLLITLGTGVGGGLVLGGKLWPGETGKAGEIGHMKITPDGPPCGCGSTGCLEVYASSTALVRMAEEEWRGVQGERRAARSVDHLLRSRRCGGAASSDCGSGLSENVLLPRHWNRERGQPARHSPFHPFGRGQQRLSSLRRAAPTGGGPPRIRHDAGGGPQADHHSKGASRRERRDDRGRPFGPPCREGKGLPLILGKSELMKRYLCIHGHFYQPPRENPWLEEVELQDSAHPYHDWNERISAECYLPNTAARIVDHENRILDIVNNYTKISFNFGPTLLSWMERAQPEVYRKILEADQISLRERGGHGNALSQVYNHLIMPLASRRDKVTQVRWGIADFESRFQRKPEGMWLPETAVDLESLQVLAEEGIRFTILAPHQARRIRRIAPDGKKREAEGKWEEVEGIDPTRSYRCFLSDGLFIDLFFYDGPISHSVAFDRLLRSGEAFVDRLKGGFSDQRDWPQLLHIATDGESYGHHFAHGDMALAYTLQEIERQQIAEWTNYGEYLSKNPPAYEVEIVEQSAWSCFHGVERWRSNCGCQSGGHPDWNQRWRQPLREGFDALKGSLDLLFETKGKRLFKDPWEARDHYITLIRKREENQLTWEEAERFLTQQQARTLTPLEREEAIQLLEMQRNALLMFTSCAWFFDEISGLEATQNLKYAGRAIQLAKELDPTGLGVEKWKTSF
ncbi:MAG: ROK family protein [Candidatus Manganitrophus sp.]|nr:ROK family protein [Candidatus Manganitrophus sp.]